jgi:hypothetical protein
MRKFGSLRNTCALISLGGGINTGGLIGETGGLCGGGAGGLCGPEGGLCGTAGKSCMLVAVICGGSLAVIIPLYVILTRSPTLKRRGLLKLTLTTSPVSSFLTSNVRGFMASTIAFIGIYLSSKKLV